MQDDTLTDLLTRFEICIREEESSAAFYTDRRAATERTRAELQEWWAARNG